MKQATRDQKDLFARPNQSTEASVGVRAEALALLQTLLQEALKTPPGQTPTESQLVAANE